MQYWWNATTWSGPGSPVVFFNPGEVAAAPYVGYLRNTTLTGYLAQEIKGAVILLERIFPVPVPPSLPSQEIGG